MNRVKIVYLFLLLSVSLNAISEQDRKIIAEFSIQDGPIKLALEKVFSISKNPREALEKSGFRFIKTSEQLVAEHPDLIPGYIIKALPNGSWKYNFFSKRTNISRVIAAKEIRDAIKKHNLQNVVVPQKYLFHIPGAREDLDDKNYIVVCERLDLVDTQTRKLILDYMTYDVAKEIIKVIRATAVRDSCGDNFSFTKDGKVAFIDTEKKRQIDILDFDWLKKLRKKIAVKNGLRRFKKRIYPGTTNTVSSQ